MLVDQSDVQIWCQYGWDNNEIATAVIGNWSQSVSPGVGPGCLRRRQLGPSRSISLFLTNMLALIQKRLSSDNKTDLHSALTEVVDVGDFEFVSWTLLGVCLGVIDLPSANTAVFPLSSDLCDNGSWSSGDIPDHCCHQSGTVDTSLPSLSAISRRENPPSQSCLNSVTRCYCLLDSLLAHSTQSWRQATVR